MEQLSQSILRGNLRSQASRSIRVIDRNNRGPNFSDKFFLRNANPASRKNIAYGSCRRLSTRPPKKNPQPAKDETQEAFYRRMNAIPRDQKNKVSNTSKNDDEFELDQVDPDRKPRWGLLFGLSVFAAGCVGYLAYRDKEKKRLEINLPVHRPIVSNWSGTHSLKPWYSYLPETLDDIKHIVSQSHESRSKIRVFGSALSPNGLGLSYRTMFTLALYDQILNIDKDQKQITVQAGATVAKVVEQLAKYDLTLQNLASITEQQIGGVTQAGCHGTGARIPPIEEQIVSMKLISPGQGLLTYSSTENSDLFPWVKCGLGCLGVVTEVTLQCVPRHRLTERVWTSTLSELKEKHSSLLRQTKHLKYLYIPYTESVVVVACDDEEIARVSPGKRVKAAVESIAKKQTTETQAESEEALKPLRELVASLFDMSAEDLQGMSFADLRCKALEAAPLDTEHVKRVNNLEAEYWKRSAGSRTDYSDKILGFDCGGHQWVYEIAFPIGSLDTMSGKDLAFMEEVLAEIEDKGLPAPGPIEQRWSASSSSYMSPAYSKNQDEVFSWVGIIMYLPAEGAEAREQITQKFVEYTDVFQKIVEKYGGKVHWAKEEVSRDEERRSKQSAYLKKVYPVAHFNQVRRAMDPHNIMSNEFIDYLLGRK